MPFRIYLYLCSRNLIERDVAQLASAPRSGRGGRKFKSSHPDSLTGKYRMMLACFVLVWLSKSDCWRFLFDPKYAFPQCVIWFFTCLRQFVSIAFWYYVMCNVLFSVIMWVIGWNCWRAGFLSSCFQDAISILLISLTGIFGDKSIYLRIKKYILYEQKVLTFETKGHYIRMKRSLHPNKKGSFFGEIELNFLLVWQKDGYSSI